MSKVVRGNSEWGDQKKEKRSGTNPTRIDRQDRLTRRTTHFSAKPRKTNNTGGGRGMNRPGKVRGKGGNIQTEVRGNQDLAKMPNKSGLSFPGAQTAESAAGQPGDLRPIRGKTKEDQKKSKKKQFKVGGSAKIGTEKKDLLQRPDIQNSG